MAPGNLSYNVRLKCYEINQSFKAIFNIHMFIERIPVYTIPKLHKPADNDAIERIALISRAIHSTQLLSIAYSSASSGKSTREIIPVAFADNLLRWHLRAYDRRRAKFVDFVFSRIEKVQPIKSGTIDDHEYPNKDTQWHTFVKLQIKAHPHNLSDTTTFDMGNEVRTVRLRAAMAGYFLRLWNVDCSHDARLKGKEYQYILSNLTKVSKVADLKLAPGYNDKFNP